MRVARLEQTNGHLKRNALAAALDNHIRIESECRHPTTLPALMSRLLCHACLGTCLTHLCPYVLFIELLVVTSCPVDGVTAGHLGHRGLLGWIGARCRCKV